MAAAEDIYMEAIIQYWEKRKELPADTNIPGYILTTVKTSHSTTYATRPSVQMWKTNYMTTGNGN